MLELMNKLDDLKKELDKDIVFTKLDDILGIINSNEELKAKIALYHNSPSEELKLEIYCYEEFIRFKEIENKINLMIMEINSKLKEISSRGGCN